MDAIRIAPSVARARGGAEPLEILASAPTTTRTAS